MSTIEVIRHGNRWGGVDTPGQPPISEHETREAAESAARVLAGGDDFTVREDDPTGLADVEASHDDAELNVPSDPGGPNTVRPAEQAREVQGGL
jgi:hypothetical protein